MTKYPSLPRMFAPSGSRSGGDAVHPSSSAFSAEDLAGPILILEDEILIGWMIESILEDAGFSAVTLVTGAAEAVASARAAVPDIMISDVNLGGGEDGIDVAQRIRETADIPVIFVSAYVDAAERDRIARDIGDAAILRKPVEVAALLDALRAILAPRRFH